LIAGSGKIARDTGMYFLKKGHAVSWVSANEARLMDLQSWVDKSVHMFMKYSGGAVRRVSASFFLYDELEDDCFDVIFECTTESLDLKKRVFSLLEKHSNETTLVLTASSSILPSRLHPACCGVHVFFPLECAKTAEIVLPGMLPQTKKDAVLAFCAENDIFGVLQNEKTAFAVNRLLLPLQNEVFRSLEFGVSSEDVNSASASPLMPSGQVDFIKKVGPEVILAAVENYRSRMDKNESGLYEVLSRGLAKLVSISGKERPGKMLGSQEYNELKRKLYYLFINTCFTFLEHNEISVTDLDHVLDSVFGAEIGFNKAVEAEGEKNILESLDSAYSDTKIGYFAPFGKGFPRSRK
jgi:3-hydroxyacyl-CoA dehydrogenase